MNNKTLRKAYAQAFNTPTSNNTHSAIADAYDAQSVARYAQQDATTARVCVAVLVACLVGFSSAWVANGAPLFAFAFIGSTIALCVFAPFARREVQRAQRAHAHAIDTLARLMTTVHN